MALSVLFHHRLLLSIIRLPNVTDDEKDSSENLRLGPSKSKQKKAPLCPLHEASSCSRIELSAVSTAPRLASKIMEGCVCEQRLFFECVAVSPASCPHRVSVGMETPPLCNKSAIVFTAVLK